MNSLQVRIRALEASNLPLNEKGTCYPVIQAKFKGLEKTFSSAVQTTVAQNTVNPHWNQEISLFANKIDDVLVIKVFDRTPGTSEKTLGRIEIPLARYLNQPMKDEWFQLVTKRAHYREWIGSKADYYAVPGLLHLQIWFGFTQGQQMPSQSVPSFVPAPVILGSAYQPISSQQIPPTPTQVYIPRP